MDSSYRRKKKQIVIVLLRSFGWVILAVSLIGAFTNIFGGLFSQSPKNIVIILDRSASMEAKLEETRSNLDRAVNWLSSLEGGLEKAQFTLIDSASQSPLPLSAPARLEGMNIAKPTGTRFSVGECLLVASNILSNKSKSTSEIWIVSDMQLSNWEVSQMMIKSLRESLGEVRIRIISLREVPKWNRSIRINSSQIGHDTVSISYTISASNSSPNEPFPLNLRIGDSQFVEDITVSPGKELTFSKTFPCSGNSHISYGFVGIPADNMPSDDTAYFACSKQAPASITLACQSRPIFKTLSAMIVAPKDEERTITSYNIWEEDELNLENQNLLIWQGSPPNRQQRENIETFLSKGGSALFMPPENHSGKMLLPGDIEWLAQDEPQSQALFKISSWVRDKGLLKDGSDKIPLPLHHLLACKKLACKGEKIRTLALWDDESPAILSKPFGKGRLIVCSTLPISSWSNMADGSVLLPLLQRLISNVSRTQTQAFSLLVGSRRIPSGDYSIFIVLDDSERENDIPLSPEIHTGIFRSDNTILAVNRSISEDYQKKTGNSQYHSNLIGINAKEYPIDRLENIQSWRKAPWLEIFFASCIMVFLMELLLLRYSTRQN